MATIPGTGQLIGGLGGPAGYGEVTVNRNDDGSQLFDISTVFPGGLTFFGHTYTSLYVNTNGSISFNTGVSTYTPTSISAGSTPMIAAYWADVDTRTPAVNGTDSAPIYVDLDTVNHVFTATWAGVNYYDEHGDKKDYFQLQLYGLGQGSFDIVFRYQSIQWTTGDASGGSQGLNGQIAHAGYTAGDGAHFSELPGSGTNTMLNLPSTVGNTGVNGLWVFPIENAQGVAGFDAYAYPGAAAMAWLKQNTNLSWVGIYLSPSPSHHSDASWMGTRAVLESQGWNIAPIYFGEQEPTDPAGNVSKNPSASKGLIDGQAAAKLMQSEGFAKGTIVYLDAESNPITSDLQKSYIKDWCVEVSAAGYIPGIYCVSSQAATIAQIVPAALWVKKEFIPTTPAPPVQTAGAFTTFPTDDPSGSTWPDAVAWQYKLASPYTITFPNTITLTNQASAHTMNVDLDTASLPAVTHGNDGQDLLTGTSGNDLIFGLGGNDTINGLTGNDKIDGGVGLDTVNFSATRASYTITPMGSGVFKVAGASGTDLLSNVEKLVFTDTTVTELHPKSDYNGDFLSDILWRRDDGATSVWDDGQVNLAHGLGAVSTDWKIVGTGDFDGNASADILWQRSDGTVSIWDNSQSTAAHFIASAGAVPAGWQIVGTGDFDGNGKSDILWQKNDGTVSIWDNGQMGGAHIIASAGAVSNDWHIVGTGDFDGNGKDDILWQRDNGTVSIWDNGQMGGAHVIASAGALPAGWHIAGTGDFDGNGKTDILWHNDNGADSIWDNGQMGGAHVIASAGTVASSWHIAGTGDYDGNGKTDILWRNDSGAVSVWDNGQMSSAHVIAAASDVPAGWHIV